MNYNLNFSLFLPSRYCMTLEDIDYSAVARWTHFIMFNGAFLSFWCLTFLSSHPPLLYGKEKHEYPSKLFLLCFTKESKSYRFCRTWRWVNADRINKKHWWTIPSKQKKVRLTVLMPPHSWKNSNSNSSIYSPDGLFLSFMRDASGSEVDIWNYQEPRRTCYKCQEQKRYVVKMQYVWKTLQMLHINYQHQHLVLTLEHISS